MTCPEVQVFDLRGEPVTMLARKWTPHIRRDPAELRGVVLHSWDVEVGTTSVDRQKYGEPLALARRALKAPYNISVGVTPSGVPVVAVAHPAERYTYASDAGNAHYISVSVMGTWPFVWGDPVAATLESTARAEAYRLAVSVALSFACEMLPGAGPHALITHRQCANGPADHFRCCGEGPVAMAAQSFAIRQGDLIADPDLVLLPEFGKTWPESWRRHFVTPARQLEIAAAVSAEHHASPLRPVGEAGNDDTQRA